MDNSFLIIYGSLHREVCALVKKCNNMIHTNPFYIYCGRYNMNQKLNYYKALQIAAAMTPRVK